MKKHLLLLVILFLFSLSLLRAGGHPPVPLSGTYLVGTGQPVYKKLKDVALALANSSNTVTGNVIFELDSDYDGTTGESFPLTFNQFNSSGNWTVTIRPKAGVTMRTTAGDPGSTVSVPLIMISGTDNLILDGRPGGTGTTIGWLIRNTRTGSSVGPVLLLQNDAQNNVFTWLQLEGQPAGGNGIVYLGVAQTTGNDNNTISHCTIRDRTDVAGKPVAGIVSASTGNGGIISKFNSGNIITHNNILNFYRDGSQAQGVTLGVGTTETQVTHNNFYQTQAVTGAAATTTIYPVFVNETAVTNTVISDNFIGGSGPGCAGAPYSLSGAIVVFRGIVFGTTVGGTGSGNVVANNTISNLDIATDTRPTGLFFSGIQIAAGQVDITNNTIGNLSATGDIKLSIGGTNIFNAMMIQFASVGGGSVTGNKIGGLAISGSLVSTAATTVYGINVTFTPADPVTFEISDNIIGSATVANSIHGTAAAMPLGFIGIGTGIPPPSTVNFRNNTIAGVTMDYSGTVSTSLAGIYHGSSAGALIDSNTISGLSTASTAVGNSPTFEGIWVAGGACTVSNNTITRLQRTATAAMSGTSGNISLTGGIALIGMGSAQVYNNKIADLASVNNLGASAATALVGIDARMNATLYNNIIYLSNTNFANQSNNTNNCEITGIRVSTAVTVNMFHNTIYIAGSNGFTTSNTAYSAAIGRSPGTTTSTCYIRNNILGNARNGGSEAHYIYYNAAANPATNWPATAANYNFILLRYANRVARWNTADQDTTQWKTTGGETNSSFYTISQLAPSNLFADFSDYEIKEGAQGYVMGKGVSGTGITTDYKGQARSATAPTIGAYECRPSLLSGTYLVGSSQPVYKKLSDIANVLSNSANIVTGNVIFELDSDYDGTTGENFPITFNQFNTSGGNWTVTIRPKAGVSMRTTSGAATLFRYDGADNIILDGRAGGTGTNIGWLIRNGGEYSSSILMSNDAQNNVFTWLQLEGKSPNYPMIDIGGTTKTQGNDNNTISYCIIRDRSDLAGVPNKGIRCGNLLATAVNSNSGLVITHNQFVNIYSPQSEGVSVWLDQGTTHATVTYNSFYLTTPITGATGTTILSPIKITAKDASNTTISHNFIGGSAPECGGTPMIINNLGTGSAQVTGIVFSNTAADTATGNTITNNTITNMDIAVEKTTNGVHSVFTGIQARESVISVENNTIGDPLGHDAIKITVDGTIKYQWYGIDFNARGNATIAANKIGGITITGNLVTTSQGLFTGIRMASSAAGNCMIRDNKIGSAAATDNIRIIGLGGLINFTGVSTTLNTPATLTCVRNTIAGVEMGYSGTTGANLIAIYLFGSGDAVVSDNLIADISSASRATDGNLATDFAGIRNISSASIKVNNNIIRDLHLTGTSPMNNAAYNNSSIMGIMINGATRPAEIYNNSLYGFTSTNELPATTATLLLGIDIRCDSRIYNNLISLDNGAYTNNCEIKGIRTFPPNVATANIFHNTIYIGGNNGAGTNTAASAAIGRYGTENKMTSYLRNNLLVNVRTGGSGDHYLYYNGATVPEGNWPVAVSDNNVLVTANTDRIGWWGTSVKDTAAWQTTGGDVNSFFYTVSQMAPANLFTDLVSLQIQPGFRKYIAGTGTGGTGIITDIEGITRNAVVPSTGAYEYSVALLENLVISQGSLSLLYQRFHNEYTDTVDFSVVSLTIAPIALDPASYIEVNGSPVISGEASGDIMLDPGSNTITIVVTSADGIAANTYTVTVIRNEGTPNNAPTEVMLSSSTVTENAAAGSVIGSLTAIDADPGSSFTYTLVSGDSSVDNAAFAISGDQLKINNSPDYETKSSYSIRVRATDAGSLFVEKGFIITVTDINDNVPAITSYGGAASLTLNAAENQTAVTTVTATDADAGAELTYSIVNGEDGSYFTINPSTGALAFITAPDFERPGDPDENNIYFVIVQVSDGLFTAVQRFKVRVTNVNDNAPEFGSYDGDAAVTLRLPENTTIVGTVWAIDKEPGTTITYSITAEKDGAKFTINSSTGVLRFITAPDYENPTDEYAANVYIVTVQASDGELASYQRFKIKITDVDEDAGRMSNRDIAIQETNADEETGQGIKAYPNPVTGKCFTLRMDSIAAGRYALELYSRAGQLVYKQQLDHAGKPIAYPIQLPGGIVPGVYMLRLQGTGTRFSRNLFIQ